MLSETSQSLKRDFWNGPVDERRVFEVLGEIRGTKM